MPAVLVKGAGVAGLAVTYELVKRGFSVEVAEKGDAVGLGASHFAGGMLAPFCEREAAEDIVTTLGLAAAGWWEAAVPGEVHRRGTLVVAQPRDLPDLVRFAARTSGHVWLDRGGVGDLEPALSGRFEKALFFEQEAHLDPRRTLAGLAEGLRERGVVFHLAGQQPADRRFAAMLDCTGAAAIRLFPELRGVRGEMLYLETPDVTLSRPIRMLHPRHPIYIVPRDNHRFMVGATMIEAEDDGPITARSLTEFLNAAYAVHPAFGEARLLETGTGIRPAFADNIPQVIETEEGLAVTGMHRHGFLLAPAMAVRAADILTRKRL
ncbi:MULTISPECIES: glycine oxidase ThiO [unclassified Neorhizobium]|uniref:glycine oxidase ThiO n=1 Tax=unclassified Neorhizobium TaxID=2629175 RepID=UPI001FF40BB9|nr:MULTISPECIES: glycine oxidase ThiO [unclassified Neorhizobium]MCJ9670325.1 glycine oxidase ThiO [Neorhizobium sp. SHOUNA12B]MCJ9746580.1 glycine oxidase ThiO [Neorhizobium sp. SHOUNA12A]